MQQKWRYVNSFRCIFLIFFSKKLFECQHHFSHPFRQHFAPSVKRPFIVRTPSHVKVCLYLKASSWNELTCYVEFCLKCCCIFFPIFNAWCFFPFNKELDWEWEKKKRAGNKEAEESNSAIKYIPGAKRKKSAYCIFKSEFLSVEQGNWAWIGE